MRVRAVLTAVTAAAMLTGMALGQTFTLPVTSTWQISTNNGATWNSGETQVPLSTTSVRVRLQVSWTPPVPDPDGYLAGAAFDGYVRGLQGAGALDTVSDISLLSLGLYQPAPPSLNLAGRRITPDLIKIDRGDSLPLGQGTVVSVGNAPAFGSAIYGTPITVFDYRLNLDGSVGSREVGLVYSAAQFPVTVLTTLPQGFTTITADASTQPATLTVVPSPAGLAVLGVASGALLRRRRC